MKKDKEFFRGALIGALAMFCVIAGGNALWKWASMAGFLPESLSATSKVENKLYLLEQMVDQYYLYHDEIDKDTQAEGIYTGYMAGLMDPYTTYYTKEQTDELMQGISGEFTGIGATMTQDLENGTTKITDIEEGSPAEEAGLQAGDLVVQVDDHKITEESLDEIVKWIRGKEGTEVTLHIVRGEEELSFTMTRRVIQQNTVEYEMKDGQIGYIYVKEFDEVTAAQFETALNDLEAQNMSGLVIDIRDNPGGNLDTVVAMLQQILPKGVIVTTKDREGTAEEYTCDGTHEFTKPLAVLVNGSSASASEVFAVAVKDHGIGTIVGETTYGKGVVQDVISLRDGSSVKITTAEYFPPSGESINKKGVEPDVKIEFASDPENPEADNQLEKALEIVRQ